MGSDQSSSSKSNAQDTSHRGEGPSLHVHDGAAEHGQQGGCGHPDGLSGGIDGHGEEDIHWSGENTILPVLIKTSGVLCHQSPGKCQHRWTPAAQCQMVS